MNSRSKSSLFLMEQLIVIIIFAICAAACVKIFVGAYLMAGEAKAMSRALLAAQSGAECYKAVLGDTEKVAAALGGIYSAEDEERLVLTYYDEEWRTCDEAGAAYILRLASRPSGEIPSLLQGEISVEKATGEEMIAFAVAVRGKTG